MKIKYKYKPQAAILKASGINCDGETAAAFELAGARSEIVHLNALRTGGKKLADYQIVVIPGGFSYGDDIASGRVFATRLVREFSEQLAEHAFSRHRPILGICNGFQILIQTGLLPFGKISPLSKIKASLAANRNDRFESRWVHLKAERSVLAFPLSETSTITLPVAHGEGRFTATSENLKKIEDAKQVVYRYSDATGSVTMNYPDNPNGADHAIAAVCDPSGVILGMMPHPERFTDEMQYPNWRRRKIPPYGLEIIKAVVSYAEQL